MAAAPPPHPVPEALCEDVEKLSTGVKELFTQKGLQYRLMACMEELADCKLYVSTTHLDKLSSGVKELFIQKGLQYWLMACMEELADCKLHVSTTHFMS